LFLLLLTSALAAPVVAEALVPAPAPAPVPDSGAGVTATNDVPTSWVLRKLDAPPAAAATECDGASVSAVSNKTSVTLSVSYFNGLVQEGMLQQSNTTFTWATWERAIAEAAGGLSENESVLSAFTSALPGTSLALTSDKDAFLGMCNFSQIASESVDALFYLNISQVRVGGGRLSREALCGNCCNSGAPPIRTRR
jgi:hypothetical protein